MRTAPRSPLPSARLRAALVALAAAAAASCGDEPAKPAGPGPSALPVRGTAAAPVAPPRAQQPLEVTLPDAPALSPDASRDTLLAAAAADVGPGVLREALLALVATSDAATVRSAASRHLAKGDDYGYADADVAAVALEALARAGDAAAARDATALAKTVLDGGDSFPALAPMLAGAAAAEPVDARKLLVRLLGDDIEYASALEALVPLREPSAAARFQELAADAEQDTLTRGTAAVGLLLLGDPRATAHLEALVRSTTTDVVPFEAIDALAVAGVPEALEWIRRVADPAIAAEDEDSSLEIRSLAAAYAAARGPGLGTKEDLDYLRSLLGRNDGMSDEDVAVALWTLGDDAQAEAVANALARHVVGVGSKRFDEEAGVAVLESIAARGAGDRRPFGRAVDAAAAIEIPAGAKDPSLADRVWRMRIAAARARLAAKK